MKKSIAAVIAASMLIATPSLAQNNDFNDRREWRDQNQRRGSGCGWLCGAIIGGVVVGALSNRRDNRDDNRYYPPNSQFDERYCVREQIVEWRYGERYIYWQTTCN